MADTPKLPFYQDPQFYRAQTYGLLVVIVLLALTLFFPLLSFTRTGPEGVQRLDVLFNRIDATGAVGPAVTEALQAHTWVLQVLQVLTAFALGAAGASLIRYRQLKLLLTNTGIVLITLVGVLGLRVYATFAFGAAVTADGAEVSRSFGLAYFTPIVALLVLLYVRQQVRKDQQRLRESERFY